MADTADKDSVYENNLGNWTRSLIKALKAVERHDGREMVLDVLTNLTASVLHSYDIAPQKFFDHVDMLVKLHDAACTHSDHGLDPLVHSAKGPPS